MPPPCFCPSVSRGPCPEDRRPKQHYGGGMVRLKGSEGPSPRATGPSQVSCY